MFSIAIDELIKEWTSYDRKMERLADNPRHREAKEELKVENVRLQKVLKELLSRGEKIIDNPSWTKTLALAVNANLLNFLHLVMIGERATNTLKKLYTIKGRILEVLLKEYKTEDMPMSQVTFKFMETFRKYCKVTYKNNDNTLWKSSIILKEIMNHAVANKWVLSNIWETFACKYQEPSDKVWPGLEQMVDLIHAKFPERELRETRDIFVFQCFAGLSYAEIYKLAPEHIITGIDGKIWVDQKRRKTEVEETLPLFPICLEILAKYKNDNRCLKKHRCLPVLTDQAYNRNLKKIAERTGIQTLNNCHQARYVFANEITHLHGVEEKTVGLLLGQRNPNTVRTYLKPNKRIISAAIEQVEKKIFGQGGPLAPKTPGGAMVITMKKSPGLTGDGKKTE